MRHIHKSERLAYPPTDDERAAYQAYQATALSDTSLTVYVIRRRELQAGTAR